MIVRISVVRVGDGRDYWPGDGRWNCPIIIRGGDGRDYWHGAWRWKCRITIRGECRYGGVSRGVGYSCVGCQGHCRWCCRVLKDVWFVTNHLTPFMGTVDLVESIRDGVLDGR